MFPRDTGASALLAALKPYRALALQVSSSAEMLVMSCWWQADHSFLKIARQHLSNPYNRFFPNLLALEINRDKLSDKDLVSQDRKLRFFNNNAAGSVFF